MLLCTGVNLMLTLLANDETGKIHKYYATEQLPEPCKLLGPSKSYSHLLTSVLSQLQSSKFHHEYDVHGICCPFLQVKVLLTILSFSTHCPGSRSLGCSCKVLTVACLYSRQQLNHSVPSAGTTPRTLRAMITRKVRLICF
jgi:hypothetical protein